jgi:hypothetical protein
MSEHNLYLPWHNDDPYPDVVLDSNGDEVASFMNNGDCDYAVKAINAHSDLVQALEKIAELEMRDKIGWPLGPCSTIARAALAKAKALEQPVGAGE